MSILKVVAVGFLKFVAGRFRKDPPVPNHAQPPDSFRRRAWCRAMHRYAWVPYMIVGRIKVYRCEKCKRLRS
jgi:hypothetical protein